MTTFTYPVAHPEGTLTTAQIQTLLGSKAVLAKRIADLTKMGFIGDYLLSGRFDATGGGIFYETGEEIFASDTPESVAALGEYPKTVLTEGEIAAAKTVKWGIESDIADEKVARQGITYVNRGLQRLANTVIRHVDTVAMAVIQSKITSTFASASAWTTAGKIAEAVYAARADRANLGTGLDLSTVVLKPAAYAKVVGMLIDDKALPREAGNVVLTGNLPVEAYGLTWATSPFATGTNPLLLDRDQLGGMADEKLGSPDYSASGNIEVRTERTGNDGHTIRARRVTVPVVTDALAGVQLTGTGL